MRFLLKVDTLNYKSEDLQIVIFETCGTLLRFHRRLPMIIGFSETIDSRSYLCKLAII